MHAPKQKKRPSELLDNASVETNSISTPVTQSVQCHFASKNTVQRKENSASTILTPNQTGMPDRLKSGLENLSGYDLSSVRVHYNSPKPKQLGALAYAQGINIHLGAGQERHLPHEAWHVVQQAQGRVKPTMQMKGELGDKEVLQGEFAAESPAQLAQPSEVKPNNTGLPDNLKAGVESLSGMSMDNVKVHYNSSEPAQLNAHAYAQGTDIHLGPGQEQHLPHEAWHVVQQAQGRVKPTVQMKNGVGVNDDRGLEREADLMGGKAVENTEEATGKNIEMTTPIASQTTQLEPIRVKDAGPNDYIDSDTMVKLEKKVDAYDAYYIVNHTGMEVDWIWGDEGLGYYLRSHPYTHVILRGADEQGDEEKKDTTQITVGADQGIGIIAGPDSMTLVTSGLVGCVALILEAQGAGFMSHVYDRSKTIEMTELDYKKQQAALTAWSTKAINLFKLKTHERPITITIVRQEGEAAKSNWMEALCPEEKKKQVIAASHNIIVEGSDKEKSEQWDCHVLVERRSAFKDSNNDIKYGWVPSLSAEEINQKDAQHEKGGNDDNDNNRDERETE